MISHNKPTIDNKETRAIGRVLKSGWIAEGKEVKSFEDKLSKYLIYKSGYAIAFSNGTSALYIALISLGIKSGEEVITSTFVCSAVLNAIYLAKAKPILVDINEDDFNISFKRTKEKINQRTKAIIIPHIFGMPADIGKFVKLGISVIEDCAQAIGSKLNGRNVGVFGKVSIFSFSASKMLTTGYGGMLFSKDKNFIEKVKDYREFDCRKKYKPRFNFQMSDFQAAMGNIQLEKLPSFLKRRKNIAKEYYKILPSNKIWPQRKFKGRNPNFYRFLIIDKKPKKFLQFFGLLVYN